VHGDEVRVVVATTGTRLVREELKGFLGHTLGPHEFPFDRASETRPLRLPDLPHAALAKGAQ